jgi:hypothetical protein
MTDDDNALREFALKLFSGKRDNTAALFGQADPNVIVGTTPIDVTQRPRPRELVTEEEGWRGEVFPDGASWLFGGES